MIKAQLQHKSQERGLISTQLETKAKYSMS